jgi:uncharacterized protein (DUF1697 family)
MTRYIAFLRGINVGGHAKIAMAELRELLGTLGLTDVVTWLQSGNALFTAPTQDESRLRATLEAAVAERFAVPSKIVVRSVPELDAVIAHDPFAGIADDGARYLVVFLSEAPAVERIAAIDADAYRPDEFRVIGREAYLWCPAGLRDSKLALQFTDRKLGVVATARNWNTVTKVRSLA